MEAIWDTPYLNGGSDFSQAFRMAREEVFTSEQDLRPEVPNFVLLLTDGVSNLNVSRTVPEAELLREEGVIIYPVGIGLVGYTHELDLIASPPSHTNRYVVRDSDELPSIEGKIAHLLCQGTVSMVTDLWMVPRGRRRQEWSIFVLPHSDYTLLWTSVFEIFFLII